MTGVWTVLWKRWRYQTVRPRRERGILILSLRVISVMKYKWVCHCACSVIYQGLLNLNVNVISHATIKTCSCSVLLYIHSFYLSTGAGIALRLSNWYFCWKIIFPVLHLVSCKSLITINVKVEVEIADNIVSLTYCALARGIHMQPPYPTSYVLISLRIRKLGRCCMLHIV